MPNARGIRRPYPRPTYRSCGKMVMGDAAKALKLAKYVKGLVNVEYKQINVQSTNVSIGTSAVHNELTNLLQGHEDTQRDGNSIRLKSIHIKGFIKTITSSSKNVVRLVVVLDKQTNQAQAAFSDIFFDNSAGDAVISDRNIDNTRRFTLLWDKVIVLEASSSAGTRYFNFYKKLNMPIRYDGNANDITDLTQNSLQFIQVSDTVSSTPIITFHARLRYLDN